MLNLLTSWIFLTCCQLRICGNVEFLLIPEKVYSLERISPGVFKLNRCIILFILISLYRWQRKSYRCPFYCLQSVDYSKCTERDRARRLAVEENSCFYNISYLGCYLLGIFRFQFVRCVIKNKQ